ncbi:MAG: nucleotidyltransferase domain-containing protein [Acidobacteriota bacterium]
MGTPQTPPQPLGERNSGPVDAAGQIADIAARFGIDVLYAFGSRAREALAHVERRETFAATGRSDLDLAALPELGRIWNVDDRVLMTIALEDVFPAPRIDLIVLPEAPPFLALAAVSGELLFARDPVREANYQLYVMRRAGDLAPFERERRAHLLATTP